MSDDLSETALLVLTQSEWLSDGKPGAQIHKCVELCEIESCKKVSIMQTPYKGTDGTDRCSIETLSWFTPRLLRPTYGSLSVLDWSNRKRPGSAFRF